MTDSSTSTPPADPVEIVGSALDDFANLPEYDVATHLDHDGLPGYLLTKLRQAGWRIVRTDDIDEGFVQILEVTEEWSDG